MTDTILRRALRLVIGAESLLVVCAVIHLGQLKGIIFAQSHPVAHDSSCVSLGYHRFLPAANGEGTVAVVHETHDIVWG
jgi:hypothetical protein